MPEDVPAPAASGLSETETRHVQGLPPTALVRVAAVDAPQVPRAYRNRLVDTGAGIASYEVPASELPRFERELLAANPRASVALDFVVAADREETPPIVPDEQLLFSGKEEFGLAAWRAAHPTADGRGVKLAVVDDGVGLARPGLERASTGEPKFAGSIQTLAHNQVPIRAERLACVPAPEAAELFGKWTIAPDADVSLETAAFVMPFDVDACGSNPELARKLRACDDYKRAIPEAGERTRLPALYVEPAEGGTPRILIDVDGDHTITAAEALTPLSSDTPRYYVTTAGRGLGFDVGPASEMDLGGTLVDEPRLACAAGAVADKVLHVVGPEDEANTGSHGEGVAGVSVGHDIGGRGFDGVAPGARLIDVRFYEGRGENAYTASHVARSLAHGGTRADIVNLSFSLYFDSPVVLVATQRLFEAALAKTEALYFFSAGNNGPGIGSMNRALAYPSMSLPVAAYLTPAMAQTVFGSSQAFGSVAVYSSRGPAFDGGPGALVMSPLAGIVPRSAESGFGPFSGTSSATPALAGMTARVLSQARAEGLPWKRDLMRRAILESAVPDPTLEFADQGFGVPKLLRALERYRALVAATAPNPPTLNVEGEAGPQGLLMRGVYVRGDASRREEYSFRLRPAFGADWTEAQMTRYVQRFDLEPSADWISVTPHLLVGRAGANARVAIDWARLAEAGPGVHLAEIKVRREGGDDVAQVIPVTVVNPQSEAPTHETTLTIERGRVGRLFMTKPTWARHLAVSVDAVDQSQALCGHVRVYDNTGGVLPSLDVGNRIDGRFTWDAAYAATTSGVYEVDVSATGSHEACPRAQTVRLRVQWLDARVAIHRYEAAGGRVTVTFGTDAPLASGTIVLSRPGAVSRFLLERDGEQLAWATTTPLAIPGGVAASVRILPGELGELDPLPTLPSWNVRLDPQSSEKAAHYLWLGRAGEWSDAATTVEGEGPYHVQAASFNFGSDQAGAVWPQTLVGELRVERDDAARYSVEVRNVTARRGAPATTTAVLTLPEPAPVGTTVACEFIPTRTSARVPCGYVRLR